MYIHIAFKLMYLHLLCIGADDPVGRGHIRYVSEHAHCTASNDLHRPWCLCGGH